VGGVVLLPVGYVVGMFSTIGSPASACHDSAAWAYLPIVGAGIRATDFGPHYVGAPAVDCWRDRDGPIAIAVTSEIIQAAALVGITTGIIGYAMSDPTGPKKTGVMLQPGAAGAPLGATFTVTSF